jgi:hypothetical protein
MTAGAVHVIDSLVHKNPGAYHQGINELVLGWSSLGIASSIYIRQSDPALLETESGFGKAKKRLADIFNEYSSWKN